MGLGFDFLSDLFSGASKLFRNYREEDIEQEDYERRYANTYMQAALALKQERIELISRIKANNKEFSYEDMLGHAKKLLLLILDSRNTQTLDHFQNSLTRNLYTNMVASYNALKSDNLINIAKDPEILKAIIKSYDVIDGNEALHINLKVKYFDYFMNSETNNFVKGNRYDKLFFKCTMTFEKNKNYDEKTSKQIINCPNCGAQLDEVYINVCKYCNTVVPLPEKEWLLADFSLVKTQVISSI